MPPPRCSSGTRCPLTMVVPLRLLTKGFTLATSCAYSGAAKLTPMISRNSTTAAMAIRLRHSRRPASAHGLRPLISGRRSSGTCAGGSADSVSAIAIGSHLGGRRWQSRRWLLLQPLLVDQDVPLGIPLIPLNALGQEVDLLRVVQVDPRRLVGHRVIDLGPDVVGGRGVGDPEVLGLGHLRLDGLVAERGYVRARVAARVDAAAAEQRVQEVRRSRVVLVPGGPGDVPLLGVG